MVPNRARFKTLILFILVPSMYVFQTLLLTNAGAAVLQMVRPFLATFDCTHVSHVHHIPHAVSSLLPSCVPTHLY